MVLIYEHSSITYIMYIEQFGPSRIDVKNALLFIPTQQIIELKLQHLFQSLSDQLRREAKLQQK